MPDINELFCLQTLDGHDLLIVKKSNFDHFLKMLPPDLLKSFENELRLLAPTENTDTAFADWVKNGFAALQIVQKEFCEKIGFPESKCSRMLKGQSSPTDDEKHNIQKELKTRLIASRLLHP